MNSWYGDLEFEVFFLFALVARCSVRLRLFGVGWEVSGTFIMGVVLWVQGVVGLWGRSCGAEEDVEEKSSGLLVNDVIAGLWQGSECIQALRMTPGELHALFV
jgi:hypothetical protein